jgi:hypothetical protein
MSLTSYRAAPPRDQGRNFCHQTRSMARAISGDEARWEGFFFPTAEDAEPQGGEIWLGVMFREGVHARRSWTDGIVKTTPI